MQVIKKKKNFNKIRVEEMNETTVKGGRPPQQPETACLQKQMYFWSLDLVIPEVTCLHNDSLYMSVLHWWSFIDRLGIIVGVTNITVVTL